MLLPGSVPILGVVVAALFLPGLAPTPSSPVNVMPVLTSIPFGAGPGQRVSHTITLSSSGTGTAAAVRVTYETTVDLGGATAKANPGRCTVSARTVVCDLGDLRFPAGASTPTITITGTVDPAVEPGTLVQNRVSVGSAQSTANPANQVASNAYLVSTATAIAQPATSAPTKAAASPSAPRSSHRVTMIAAVLLCAVALAVGLLFWRRRQRRLVTASPGKSEG